MLSQMDLMMMRGPQGQGAFGGLQPAPQPTPTMGPGNPLLEMQAAISGLHAKLDAVMSMGRPPQPQGMQQETPAGPAGAFGGAPGGQAPAAPMAGQEPPPGQPAPQQEDGAFAAPGKPVPPVTGAF